MPAGKKAGNGRKMPISSIEVARLAGVSQAAVSRVYTPGASVSDEMRERVLVAAKQLGYRPNAIARSLTQRSTHMIGLVMVHFMNPFYARLLQEFTAKLQALGYWTLLLNIAHGDELEKALPMALQYQVDGIIITSATLSSRMADECAQYGTPVVLFNRYSLDSDVNAVCCDSVRGGRLVADALVDTGHQRFAYIAGEAGSSTNQDRERGFTIRLRERGHDIAFAEQADYSYESGYSAAKRLLERPDRPDAIFCANDMMAMAALDVARSDFGIRVPDELSVVGFDDIQMACWPKYDLTTVRQPVERMVDATIELLLSAIDNPDGERILRMIPPTLAVRTSARVVLP